MTQEEEGPWACDVGHSHPLAPAASGGAWTGASGPATPSFGARYGAQRRPTREEVDDGGEIQMKHGIHRKI